VARRTWLIVPIYNEGPIVGEVIQAALRVFPNIVCVDDGSTDNSAQAVHEAGATLVQHPINLGQGAALRTGLDYALSIPDADFFVTFDSDGQHQVEDAVAMVERLDSEPLDVVIGSRFLDKRTKVGFVKSVVLRLAILFERISTGIKLTDAHNGLRALNRHAATVIEINQNRMAHASEIPAQIARNKLRYAEQPVHVVYSAYSKAKGQSVWNSINILNDLFFK
jgi:glycosyltransferase involved in cell wall biosynthesis